MKRIPVLSAVLLIILAISCNQNTKNPVPSKVSDSKTLLQLITNPPSTYRAAPLWDWNDKITREEIEFQMKKFKEGGLGGVFIHPRPGLVTEYLSDDWNELFQYTVQTAKKLGMQVWIYDENSYPSGFAGGHVPARFPDSYQNGTGLGLKMTQDLKEISDLPVEVLLKQTVKPADSQQKPTYYVFYRTFPKKSYWYGGFSYVDLLYPGVTDTFMKVTMEGYEKYNKEDFGKTLAGIFTDEPNLEAAKGAGTVIRWTPDLFDQFEIRWGYRLEPEMVSLVEETDNYMMVRHDYYTLLLEMFLDRWAIPWFNYCEQNNLDWTGHYWEHGWPYPGEGIDEAAFYMYHQMPGVDMLGRGYDSTGYTGNQFGNTRALRELGSAANQSGWNRRLSETCGGAGWQISFAEMKRLIDWEVVMGVNFVNPHLSYFSLQGVRKFDYPPSFSYQEPWWDNFSLLGDYIGRICLAMSAGEQLNNILILQPNTTAWMYHTTQKDDKRIYDLSVTFKKFIQTIENNNVEYDLGSEQVIKRFGETDKKGLKIRNRIYDHIILPPGIRNVESTTLNRLKDYLSDGYTILCLSDSIDYVDGRPNKALQDLAAKYPVNWIKSDNIQSEHVLQFLANADINIKQTDLTKVQLFHQRRILDDGQLLFLVNSDLSNPAEADIKIKGRFLSEINLISGLPLPVEFNKKNGLAGFKTSIPPGGSKLFFASNDQSIAKETVEDMKSQSFVKSSSELQSKRLSPNVLTVDYLDLETKSFRNENMYFMTAMRKLFEISGLETGNPWQHKIQYKQQYLQMDNFTNDSWFKVRYHFTVDPSVPDEAIKAMQTVIERPDQWTVKLNGKDITPSGNLWWLDRHFPVYQIGEYIAKGENIIELSAPKMTVFSELMPIYVLGEFSLESADKGFLIKPAVSPGLKPWKEGGIPFYSNQVSYYRSYTIEDTSGKFFVQMGTWRGSVAEVWVNGKKAGNIGWKPYEMDITDYIQKGENNIDVRVTGSLKSTLGYHHAIESSWMDGPFSWNQGPDKQPAGMAYQFLNYGLYKEFDVIRKVK